MNLLIRNVLKLLAVIAVLSTLVVSCEDPYQTIDYSKYEKEELQLLREFLDLNLDSMKLKALKTVDLSKDTNIVYFKMETGVGDSVEIGDVVGFRYTYYEIYRDDNDLPALSEIATNLNSENPYMYIAGDSTSSASPGKGIDNAIRRMRHLGRSKVIIPSKRMVNTEYRTIVADVKLEILMK